MHEYMLWIWLGLFVVALFIEFVTADFVTLWFSVASVPSFILALAKVDPYIQIALFVFLTIIMLIFTRPVVMKYFKTNEIKTNVDAFIGANGVCLEEINLGEIGKVKVRNQRWSAISNEKIEIGETVRVLDIEGAKVIVKKI